jgi:hypothetical protein
VEFGIANSLKNDSNARRIGSAVLDVLPVGIASFTLNTTMRFDTLTAYTAMLNNSSLAFELEFLGATLPSSLLREGIKFQFPKVKVNMAGDPEIGGPDELLTSEVELQVLRDDSSATGFACRAIVTNDTATML